MWRERIEWIFMNSYTGFFIVGKPFSLCRLWKSCNLRMLWRIQSRVDFFHFKENHRLNNFLKFYGEFFFFFYNNWLTLIKKKLNKHFFFFQPLDDDFFFFSISSIIHAFRRHEFQWKVDPVQIANNIFFWNWLVFMLGHCSNRIYLNINCVAVTLSNRTTPFSHCL